MLSHDVIHKVFDAKVMSPYTKNPLVECLSVFYCFWGEYKHTTINKYTPALKFSLKIVDKWFDIES